MTRALVIDDVRTLHFGPNVEVVTVRTPAAALAILADETQAFDEVWFDHDLNATDDVYPFNANSRAVADWLAADGAAQNASIQRIYVHSANPRGAEYLMEALGARWPTFRVDPWMSEASKPTGTWW